MDGLSRPDRRQPGRRALNGPHFSIPARRRVTAHYAGYSRRLFILSVIICLFLASIGLIAAQTVKPRAFLASPDDLLANSAFIKQGDPAALKSSLLDKLVNSAEFKALVVLPKSEYPNVARAHGWASLPNGATKNSYVSFAPYYYPDPSKPDGLPWIKVDGCVSPVSNKPPSTRDAWGEFVKGVEGLALAAYYSLENPGLFPLKRSEYAAKAVDMINVFLINPETKMDPSLSFAQLRNDGRERVAFDWGVDVVSSPELIDALGLLESFPEFTADLQTAVKKWVTDLLASLDSQIAVLKEDIQSSRNNIRTIYEVFRYAVLLYTSNPAAATLNLRCLELQKSQILGSGDQPLESSRPDSFLYSSSNLVQHTRLARLSDRLSASSSFGSGACWTPALEKAAEYLSTPVLWSDISCWPHTTRDKRVDLAAPSEAFYTLWKRTSNTTYLAAWTAGQGTKISRWRDLNRLWFPNSASSSAAGVKEAEIAGWIEGIPRPACLATRATKKAQSCEEILTGMYKGTKWEYGYLGTGNPSSAAASESRFSLIVAAGVAMVAGTIGAAI